MANFQVNVEVPDSHEASAESSLRAACEMLNAGYSLWDVDYDIILSDDSGQIASW